MKSLLLHAWLVHQKEDKYYLPYVHWVYLNEIVKYYDSICLLTPVKIIELETKEALEDITVFKNVSVFPLPYSEGYIDTVRHFFSYRKAYSQLKNYTTVYTRYPNPFGWLQKIYMKNARRIIHFVGDPIDTIKNNPHIPFYKKKLLIAFFMPEHWMFLWACKGADVYTNGYHIAAQIKKKGINAQAMISSTLNKEDYYFDDKKEISIRDPSIIYVGYLRKAKGVETVIKSFSLFQKEYPKASLTIVGSGESECELKILANKLNIKNIVFTGFVDDRNELNQLLRNHDIFCFASLSEGSPRVILEAMANGINVVSTPVGALPYVFKDNIEILFADFSDIHQFKNKLSALVEDNNLSYTLRKNAFLKVQDFTINTFLKEIFYEA